jgi:MFS family permease
VGIGLVVSVISSLGAPLIPGLARELDSSLSATQWSLTVTLLVGAVTSPVIGRLGDGPSRRIVLVGSLAIVTLGGVIAAVANTLPVLIVGRAMQGLGLAMMPLTMASARDHLPATSAGRVIALLSVVGPIGVGLGYPITGFVAERFDASAAFWFGAFASAVALALAALFVPPASTRTRPPLDVRGAFLIGGGVLALLLAIEKGTDWGWASANTVGLLLVAVVLLALFTWNELRVVAPLVELRLVRHRSVLSANVSALMLGISMYLGIALITQVVQLEDGIDASVFVAGLTLVPLSIMSALSARLIPRMRRLGPRGIVPLGCLMIAVAMTVMALDNENLAAAFVTMALVGLGLGLTFAAIPGLIIGAVPQSETGSAMSFYQVTRYIGFAIGSGLAVTLLRAFSGDGPPGTGAYSSTFAVGAGLAAVTAVVAWVLSGPGGGGAIDDERAIEEGELGAAGLQRLETG